MNSNRFFHAGHHMAYFTKGCGFTTLTLLIAAATGVAGCGVLGLVLMGEKTLAATNLSGGFDQLADATMASAGKTHENFYKTFHHCPEEGNSL